MFPGVFEWIWDPGHLIFMGIFWSVMLILLSGVGLVLVNTMTELSRIRDEDPDNVFKG